MRAPHTVVNLQHAQLLAVEGIARSLAERGLAGATTRWRVTRSTLGRRVAGS